MTLTQISYILAVAKHKQFALAAQKSFVSQPTLSVGIQKAEEELGVTIFDRKKQPVVPTPIGKVIIDQARVILRETARLEEVVKEQKDMVQGDYILGIIPTIGGSLIPLFLKPFSKKHPNVNLAVEEKQTEALIENLINDEIDAGIASTPLHHPELEERPLYNEPFYLYVSESHPLARRKKVQQSDLRNEQIWLLGEGHCFRNQVQYLCKLREEQKGFKNINFESGNFQTLVRLVEQDVGLTLLPHLVASQFQGKRKTLVKEFTQPIPMRQISLVYRRSLVKKGITDALATTIQSVVSPQLLELKKGAILPPV